MVFLRRSWLYSLWGWGFSDKEIAYFFGKESRNGGVLVRRYEMMVVVKERERDGYFGVEC